MFFQDSFKSVSWSVVKKTILMIGEIDYGSIIIEAKEQVNEQNGAPLVPVPGFTAFVIPPVLHGGVCFAHEFVGKLLAVNVDLP